MDQEIVNLINFFIQKKRLSREDRERFTRLLARDANGSKPVPNSNSDIPNIKSHTEFDNLRKSLSPLITADFLSLFNKPSALKFLTHNFDPDLETSISEIVKRANTIVAEWEGRIPESLEKLLTGFLSSGHWLDFMGKQHNFSLSSALLKEWCKQNKGIHPIVAAEFEDEIQDFRKTIRVIQPNLQYLVDDLIKGNEKYKNITLNQTELNRADFYTNVLMLRSILRDVINDIVQRDSKANVRFVLDRGREASYRTYTLKITHTNSIANNLEEVQNKLRGGGGALYNIFKKCIGYCDWSIISIFDSTAYQWHVIDSLQKKEITEIIGGHPEGFTHLFTFYKKIQ